MGERNLLEKCDGKGGTAFLCILRGTAYRNGKPGIHHVIARALKDSVCRYKTMQGYKVKRKAGWDTHGLPVEIEVEKRLKMSGKQDIEKYGIKEFNEKCRDPSSNMKVCGAACRSAWDISSIWIIHISRWITILSNRLVDPEEIF